MPTLKRLMEHGHLAGDSEMLDVRTGRTGLLDAAEAGLADVVAYLINVKDPLRRHAPIAEEDEEEKEEHDVMIAQFCGIEDPTDLIKK